MEGILHKLNLLDIFEDEYNSFSDNTEKVQEVLNVSQVKQKLCYVFVVLFCGIVE